MNFPAGLYSVGGLPVIRMGTAQKIAVGGTSAASAAVSGSVVRLVATVDCHVAIGPAPVADASSTLLPANSPEYFACAGTDKVAVINDGIDGELYVTPAAAV